MGLGLVTGRRAEFNLINFGEGTPSLGAKLEESETPSESLNPSEAEQLTRLIVVNPSRINLVKNLVTDTVEVDIKKLFCQPRRVQKLKSSNPIGCFAISITINAYPQCRSLRKNR